MSLLAYPFQARGIANEGEAKYSAARQNETMAQERAAYTGHATTANAISSMQEGAQQLGSIRAAYGASGVKESGTAADVEANQQMINQMKMTNIQTQGAFNQMLYGQEAQQYGNEANYDLSSISTKQWTAGIGDFGSSASTMASLA